MSRGFLLDTNVLSATAPDRRVVPEPAKARARRWLEDQAERLWLPIVAVGEIAAGIGKREGDGATRHAAELAEWLGRPFKLMAHQRQEVHARRAGGETLTDIARNYNVCLTTISRLAV